MDAGKLAERVKRRYLDGEYVPDDAVIKEMLATVADRITIRMETTKELPDTVGSIVVDAAVKALRLRGYEGSTSESASEGGSVSNSFIDDVLAAYSDDLEALKRTMHKSGIKFLK